MLKIERSQSQQPWARAGYRGLGRKLSPCLERGGSLSNKETGNLRDQRTWWSHLKIMQSLRPLWDRRQLRLAGISVDSSSRWNRLLGTGFWDASLGPSHFQSSPCDYCIWRTWSKMQHYGPHHEFKEQLRNCTVIWLFKELFKDQSNVLRQQLWRAYGEVQDMPVWRDRSVLRGDSAWKRETQKQSE